MRAIRSTISALAAGAALTLAVTACTGSTTTIIERPGSTQSPGSTASGSTGTGGTATATASPSAKPSPAGPAVTITPGASAAGADPSKGITVSSPNGQLAHVTVSTSGDPVTGTFAADRSSWHSTWALNIAQSYTVTAIAVGKDGVRTTKTTTFRTLQPTGTFSTHIFEGFQQTYGVGMPIMLTFSSPIRNKAAVERAIEIKTSKRVFGAWYWDGTQTLEFRPRDYWPAHSTVSFTGHFDGVQAAPGLYGYHTLTQTFNIGDSVIAVASTRTHRTQIYVNGKKKYDWPVSTGKTGDDTPNGSYLTIEKANPVRMTGPGYDLLVPWSVRFTFSGDYYHDAYWSTGQQGFENVSHGCVNLSPANAETYYKLAVPGDPVTIKGSPRPGTWDNGWTVWFLTWSQLLKGSATGQAVSAGPSGSQFVSPSGLPKSEASYPLSTAEPGNDI
ncbi:L,D-transpeptidase [Trebonia kvetii]|uniref:L,D-transpeptidase n=1 Tax=Trebonia kvetii TaxID=2480626 RepID=A0A6P2BQ57_9ACTN|nr:Ig-like domain-containing protein [Trebonia kvetii]TVZ00797.1 L,D-transpeptidase [Trebonia kvetii]